MTSALCGAPQTPALPDLTQGGKRDENHDWLLGPTGARGWVFFQREDQTAASRQILITAVDAGSPADGVLRVNDVITVGQSAVGTWGHEYSTTPGGNLNGYGCMNQQGIVVTLSLVLARQAGVNDPAVDRAIDKSAKFLRYCVNKGAIPYGDHQPGGNVHDDNGKCSSAAVLFDLLGDREAAAFYSRMATAAYDEREHGHCGNVWNMLWAMPGDAMRNFREEFPCQPVPQPSGLIPLGGHSDFQRITGRLSNHASR